MMKHSRCARPREASSRPVPGTRFSGKDRQKPLVAGALALLAWLAFGCQKEPIKPVDLIADDLCAYCKGVIVEKQYAAEFITKDGFVRKFDDISCMVQHAKTKVKPQNIEAYFIVDFPSQKWVPAQEAKFVKSDKFKTPKDGGILAFQDPAKAQALASQYQAQVLTLDELLK